MIADTYKRKRGEKGFNRVTRGYAIELRQNRQNCQEHRKVKVKELKKAIKDPKYINQAIDCLADKLATTWMKEKYGETYDI